jgi:uncharacterized membrane protein
MEDAIAIMDIHKIKIMKSENETKRIIVSRHGGEVSVFFEKCSPF